MSDLVTQSPVLRISSEDRIVDGDDGKLLYRGDLGRRQTFRFTRSVTFWPWGGQPSLGSGRLSIENGDGGYDQIALVDIRNRPAALSVLTDAGRVPIVTPIVDSVVADRDERVEFTLADGLAKFDVPAVGGFFEDDGDTNAGLVGKPLPILIGPCRSVPIVLWDPLHQGGAYRANYAPLAGAAGVFDSGVLLDPTAPQWEFDTRINNAGIFLNQSTAGKIVADVSAIGDGSIPADPIDLMSGRGFFITPFDGVSNPGSWGGGSNSHPGLPEGWNAAAGSSGDGDKVEHSVATASRPDRMRITHKEPATTQPFGNIGVVFVDDTAATPFRFVEGTRYRIKFNLVRLDGGWSGTVAGFFVQNPATLSIYTANGDATGLGSGFRLARYSSFDTSGDPGERSFTFTASSTHHSRPLQFNVAGPFAIAEIANIEIVEVPATPDQTLPGLTLRDYMLEVVRLSGWSVDTVNLDDLDAIDPLAASVGFFTAEQVQALSLMRAPLNSYTAGMYSDRAGRVRFTRMIDPAQETPEFFVNADNLSRPPSVRLDPAEGLTTSATAQRNWYQYSENELAGSIAELSLADRIKFTQAARRTVNATVPDSWPEQYRHALNASPLPTLYDDEAVAQVEIQRIVDIYSTLRLIVDVEILVDGPDGLPEIGMIAELKYHRFGLADGRNMLVASITDLMEGEARQLKVTMRLWG